ncbi:MAG TPA: ABC transporter substrate-binding protein [Candidatus Saccharimonadales bacterium]|nr:ABC transporter substrate-binding protein [Candidatus Saccharimonadales bacterium]
MFRRIRFFYLYLVAVLKKQWKSVAFVVGALLILVVVFNLLLPRLGQNITAYGQKIVKPTYKEAIVGEPKTFNPLFSRLESEKDIDSLVFSGLTKINKEGNVVPDLAESIEIKGDTEYIFHLRKDVFWQDGEKFSADDVVYSIGLAQNPLYESVVANNFRDVKVEKINDQTVSFKLKEPFAPFLTATTLGLIPKHISLTHYRPVGTGKFRFSNVSKGSVTLENSSLKLKFQFYPNEEAALTALRLGEIHSLAGSRGDLAKVSDWKNYKVAQPSLPYQLVTLFFNTKEAPLSEKNIRQALTYSLNKEELVKDSLGSKGKVASNSYADIPALQENIKEKYSFNLDKANSLLTAEGWTNTGGKLVKDGKLMTVTITTLAEPDYENTAQQIKKSWEKLGIEVTIQAVSGSELKDSIVPNRSFSVLLSSLLLNSDPDQYVLWHTTQIKEGNITGVAQPKLDKLLEDGRKSLDPKVRVSKYQEFAKHLLDEDPAVFLYYPNYTWIYSNRLQNLDLKDFRETFDRFSSSDSWSLNRPLI